jgi:GTP-binding protein HflX
VLDFGRGRFRTEGDNKIPKIPQSTAIKVEKAILVGLDTSGGEDSLAELTLLADTAGAVVTGSAVQRRASIDSSSFLSKGKREQVRDLLLQHEAELLIFDQDLSPAQARNLEKDLKVRVVDRTELILDIFARRARTREAMLQVELAQLEYILPRLTRMWEHFGRLGGGIGTRGPGETQLEVDRRRVRHRITMLKEKLEGVERERETQRKRRTPFFRAALVGYTNAGKSTWFNALTRAGVLAEDKLFATLDTTTRQIVLPGNQQMLLSDTVGFIRKLPHHLVASFRATLLEVREADLIIHVVDASHPAHEEQMRTVEEVLGEILPGEVARLVILNKADLFKDEVTGYALKLRHPDAEILSAVVDADVERFRERLARELSTAQIRVRVIFPTERLAEAREIARRGCTLSESFADATVYAEYALPRAEIDRLRQGGFRVQFLNG